MLILNLFIVNSLKFGSRLEGLLKLRVGIAYNWLFYVGHRKEDPRQGIAP